MAQLKKWRGRSPKNYVYFLGVLDALVLAMLVFVSIGNVSGSRVEVSPWVYVFGVGMLIVLIAVATGKER